MSDKKSDNVYDILTNAPYKAHTLTTMKQTAQKTEQRVANGLHEDVMILKEQVKNLATKEDVALLSGNTEAKIAVLQTKIAVLQTDVNAIKGDIAELKSDVRHILRILTYASIGMVAFLASILATLLVKPM